MDEKNILLMDIFSLSMKIQDKTNYGIFVDFSGHIDQIKVRVTKTKADYLERVITFDAYTDSNEYSFTEEDAISDLKEMRDDVETFYEKAVYEVSTDK